MFISRSSAVSNEFLLIGNVYKLRTAELFFFTTIPFRNTKLYKIAPWHPTNAFYAISQNQQNPKLPYSRYAIYECFPIMSGEFKNTCYTKLS